jgi:hypothetical protein
MVEPTSRSWQAAILGSPYRRAGGRNPAAFYQFSDGALTWFGEFHCCVTLPALGINLA